MFEGSVEHSFIFNPPLKTNSIMLSLRFFLITLVFLFFSNYSIAQISDKQFSITAFEKERVINEKSQNEFLTAGVLIFFLSTVALTIIFANQKRKAIQLENEKQTLIKKLREREATLNNERQEQRLKLEQARLDQRKKFSSDIHDNISSGISALRYYVSDLKSGVADTKVRGLLENIEEETNTLYKQTREYMRDFTQLQPEVNYNVNSLLNNLNKKFHNELLLKVETSSDELNINKFFTGQQHYELYLLIKEAVTNVLKHAGASRIFINIALADNIFTFSIIDNGKNAMFSKEKSGQGIHNMQDRIARLFGKIKFKTDEKGTSVSGCFPMAHLNIASEILVLKNVS